MFIKELEIKAADWLKYVENTYKSDINKSVINTRIYSPEFPSVIRLQNPLEVILVQKDSVSCAFEEELVGRVAILNFASYKTPGGFFLEGSTAQEEALCHESNLYPILREFKDSYYAWNNKHLNKALYLDRALYSPDVVFEHRGEIKRLDVITCAAPNHGTACKYGNVSYMESVQVMRARAKFMFSIAAEEEVDTLIAGAWGCGVFKQNPYEVAKILTEEAKGRVRRLYLAVPRGANYTAFENVLS